MTQLLTVKPNHVVPVTERFLTTGEVPTDWSRHTEETGEEIDLQLLKELCAHATAEFPAKKQSGDDPDELTMDAWLAPRMHWALRIPRRIAADGGIWTWLALECRDYLRKRFDPYQDDEIDTSLLMNRYRVRTEILRNGIARLWWGGEMLRNGPDYSDVEPGFLYVRTAEFALELYYSLYRPAAIAFVRVAEGRNGGDRLGDKLMNKLSKRLRVYLSLRGLEFAHSHEAEDTYEFDEEWASHVPRFEVAESKSASELEGPSHGRVDEESIKELCEQMREIVAELKLEMTEEDERSAEG